MSKSFFGGQTDESRYDRAKVAEDLNLRRALATGRAPLKFQLLFVARGDEQFLEFECTAAERIKYLRKTHGINLDNVTFALRNQRPDGRWGSSVGDRTLCKQLDRRR